MSIFTDSITAAQPEVELSFLKVAEDRWILRATNSGSVFLAFFPNSIHVVAPREAALGKATLTLRGNHLLNPGESVDFDLHIGCAAGDSSRKKLTLHYSLSGLDQRWHSQYLP